jgi:hypothetical protein
MTLGIMQPYFFPYIGYWQLIKASDEFILFDDVQYIRHGWINRNRIIKPKEGWIYITVPLKKHSREDVIKNISASDNVNWSDVLFNPLKTYEKTAPFYSETLYIIGNILKKINDNEIKSITKINHTIIAELCSYLNINTKITVSSHHNFDYYSVNGAGDWALEISKQKKASAYINPISGRELFDKEKFSSNGINILFLKPQEITYNQKRKTFEPWLSIIDVLMFNGREETIKFLNYYDITEA